MIRFYGAFISLTLFLFLTCCNITKPTQTCITFATTDMTEWSGCDNGAPSVLFFSSATPLYKGDMPASGTYQNQGYLQLNLTDNDYTQLRSGLSERMNLIIDAFKRHTYKNGLHEVQMPLVNQQSEEILSRFYSANSEGEGVYVINPATGQKVLLKNVDYICFANTALLPVVY